MPAEALVVAVRAAAVPVDTGAFESAIRELTLPLPVPSPGSTWCVELPGLVQVWSTDDFSLQALTSQEPACATATEGAMKLVVAVLGAAVPAEAVTAEVPPVLR